MSNRLDARHGPRHISLRQHGCDSMQLKQKQDGIWRVWYGVTKRGSDNPINRPKEMPTMHTETAFSCASYSDPLAWALTRPSRACRSVCVISTAQSNSAECLELHSIGQRISARAPLLILILYAAPGFVTSYHSSLYSSQVRILRT